MKNTIWIAAVFAAMCVSAADAAEPRQGNDNPSIDYRATVVDKYCVTCHNARSKTGGLVLEKVDVASPGTHPELWEKVIRKVRSGAMPPVSAAKPPATLRAGFVSYLEKSLDAAAGAAPNPGRPVVHRLNRAEYANAVRDLLRVDIDGASMLPADDSSYGFDNVADVLSVSTGLLERYLLVAKKVSRIAVGDPTVQSVTQTFPLPIALLQEDRMSDDLPLGTRGGASVRYTAAADGEYAIQLKLQRSNFSSFWAVRGLDEDNIIKVFVDGAPVRDFNLPATRLNLTGLGSGTLPGEKLEAKLKVHVPLKAGTHTIGVAMPRSRWYFEGVGAERMPLASAAFVYGIKSEQKNGKIELAIDKIEVSGPIKTSAPSDSPSRRRIFICRPAAAQDDEACATRIVTTLARRAYRRPVTRDDVTPLMAFYAEGRKTSFDRGIQLAIERLLVSPYFLLRKEQDPVRSVAGGVYPVSDIELASRLSFFLWSSIPDDELLALAEQRKLSNPAVMDKQVARMLRDPRSSALTKNFFGQWLGLRIVDVQRPDIKLFPEFDENLRAAFRRETEMFIESQIHEDRSALELLTANYTFLNERLAKHYGIPSVYGSHFRRVTLPDGPRAGLLGHGSILTVTSYPDRTSPVLRGKWLLENLLAAPPPPPPADVPPFPENKDGDAPKTVRARMEMHRRNPVCASCHAVIDPLGFALENFDAVGRHRSRDGDALVDASGTFPDGTKFSGPAEFRTALATRRAEIMEGLTEKLLTYALGRGVSHDDMPAIRRITREASARDFRWSAIIGSIVRSDPFRLRRAES